MTLRSEPDIPPLQVSWCGRSVKGIVRQNNEDALWAAPLGATGAQDGDSDGEAQAAPPGMLFAVADGMGGALAGEVASGLAVQTLGAEMARRSRDAASNSLSDEACADLFTSAVEAANACIRGEGESNPQRRGMGTTLTAVWVRGRRADVVHVGDSRAYLFRRGYLKQLTRDQSLVGKLLEDGIISEEEAERMAGRNIILQALGTEEPLQVMHESHDLQPGDVLLLCTDGLSGVVGNRDIEEEMRRGGDPCDVCQRLVDLAEHRGGPDNITVLLARARAGE